MTRLGRLMRSTSGRRSYATPIAPGKNGQRLLPRGRWLKAARMPIRIVVVLLLWAAAALAATVDGQEWPPDPKRYDPPGTAVAPGLKVGETLDEKNAAAAKDLLPPEIQKHYEAGEYRNEIASWPEGLIHHERSFEE